MIKLLSKFSMSSGVVTSAFLVNVPLNNTNTIRPEKTKLDEIKKGVEKITTLKDIEIFEKANGCSFAFVGAWDNKDVYTLKKFLKIQNNNNAWEEKIINGAESYKSKCKSNGSVALFHNGTQFQLDPAKLPGQ